MGMRMLITTMALTLAVPFAQARERRQTRAPSQIVNSNPQTGVATVDDEPSSGVQAKTPEAVTPGDPTLPDPGRIGERIRLKVEAPRALPVGDIDDEGTVETHGVKAVSARPRVEPSASGATDLIAERELRKHQGEIDTCVAQAVKRKPAATGTVELSLEVQGRRVAHATIGDDTVKDAALAQCLTTAASSWMLPLANAHVSHVVTVSPSAAR